MARRTEDARRLITGSTDRTGTSSSRIRRTPKRGKRRLARAAVVLGALILVGVLSGAWLAYRANQVQTNLEAAADLLPELQSQLVAGDGGAAEASLDELRSHTSVARDAGTDPLWKAASIIPILGPNFSAITEVTVSADDVVTRAVAPMLSSFDSLDWDALTPRDGRIDVAPLQKVSPTLSSAANTVQLSFERLAGIDRSGLLPQVAAPLEQAIESMDDARQALHSAASAAEILPPMMGADGPRTYLVLIQNSAEIRATGGISGAFALLRTDDGSIDLVGQGSGGDLGRFNPPLEVDPQQVQIYSTRIGGFFQSANLTPDFPTVAQTTKRMWETRNPGTVIDGVIALDPVVLANILEATGPVELGEFDDPAISGLIAQTDLPTALTAQNVVTTLLSDVYAQIEEPSLQDSYFAAVAGKIFSAVADGQGDSGALVDALTRSTEEDRLYLWSNTSSEQDVITETTLAGAATGPRKGGAAFDVYFNDGTGAKMDYYVRRTVQVIETCSDEGSQQFTLQVSLTNTAPADAAETLPAYVTGSGAFGVPPGSIRTNTIGYGPAQAALGSATLDGAEIAVGSYRHGNRPVGVVTTEIAPGETAVVELSFTDVVQETEPVLGVTPTVQSKSEVLLKTERGASCQ